MARPGQGALLPGIEAYEAGIRDIIGLRQQPGLAHGRALGLTDGTAAYRDLSLRL